MRRFLALLTLILVSQLSVADGGTGDFDPYSIPDFNDVVNDALLFGPRSLLSVQQQVAIGTARLDYFSRITEAVANAAIYNQYNQALETFRGIVIQIRSSTLTDKLACLPSIGDRIQNAQQAFKDLCDANGNATKCLVILAYAGVCGYQSAHTCNGGYDSLTVLDNKIQNAVQRAAWNHYITKKYGSATAKLWTDALSRTTAVRIPRPWIV